jgi:hypothetical protein
MFRNLSLGDHALGKTLNLAQQMYRFDRRQAEILHSDCLDLVRFRIATAQQSKWQTACNEPVES